MDKDVPNNETNDVTDEEEGEEVNHGHDNDSSGRDND